MNEPVKIICPLCYSPDLSMYMEGLSSASAGTLTMPAGNVSNNNMELRCNACGHTFKPGDGKLSQEQQGGSYNNMPSQQSMAPVSSNAPDDALLLNMVATQGKLTAVKYACEQYGWGLKQSKDYIDGLTSGMTYSASTPQGAPDTAAVVDVLKAQGMLVAIKFVKDNTRWDLKQSKEYVDNLIREHNLTVKKGCFIATACYGDYDAPEVRFLRQYRDQVLSRSLPGRLFIKVYYALSPPLAQWLERSEVRKQWVKRYVLHPILRKLRQSAVIR